jgi:hypothetical protein
MAAAPNLHVTYRFLTINKKTLQLGMLNFVRIKITNTSTNSVRDFLILTVSVSVNNYFVVFIKNVDWTKF